MPKVRKLGVGFLNVNKICFKHFVLLLLCAYVHNWSVSQWKQYELQIWSSWRNINFWKWKVAWNSTMKTDMLSMLWVLCVVWHAVSAFDAFNHVHHYMTNQNITSVTDLHRGDTALHSAYKIDYHYILFSELEVPECPLIECYVCWNVSWPGSAGNPVKNWPSLLSKLYSSHCGTSLHQVPMFYFTAKRLGSF